jgi:cytochrome c
MSAYARIFAAAVILTGSINLATAGDRATAEEAKALLDKAVAHAETVGTQQAYTDFSRPDGGFVDRDLYVYCIDMQGNALAHGANPAIVGKNILELKDSDGVQPVKEGIRIAQTTGQGTLDVKWPNPITKKIEQKAVYISKVKNDWCGVGYYRS